MESLLITKIFDFISSILGYIIVSIILLAIILAPKILDFLKWIIAYRDGKTSYIHENKNSNTISSSNIIDTRKEEEYNKENLTKGNNANVLENLECGKGGNGYINPSVRTKNIFNTKCN